MPTLTQPQAPTTSPTHATGQDALTGALNLSFRLLRGVMLLVLVAYLLSGIFIVGQHERAYVLVFGKITGLGSERLKEPGIHWTWPRPIAEIVRIPTERVQAVESSTFWPNITAEHANPPADSFTLTGDANLIHSRWAVRYTVTEPETFVFRLGNPELLLRRELDHAVVKCTGRLPVDQALRTDIEGLRGAIERELRRRADALALGIRIERVDVLAVSPPKAVAAAFAAVIESEQDRSTRISAARATSVRAINEAQGEAARLRAEGETYQRQVVAAVSASADYFTKVLAEYQKNPDIIARTLRQDALRRALSGVEQKFLLRRNPTGEQELRLLLNPEPKPVGAAR